VRLGEGLNSLVVVADRLEDLTGTLPFLDAHQAGADNGNDLLDSVLGIGHGDIENVHPDLLKMILV
jgi:hypothetical protein